MTSNLVETVVAHLGGEPVLTQIGARDFFSDGDAGEFPIESCQS